MSRRSRFIRLATTLLLTLATFGVPGNGEAQAPSLSASVSPVQRASPSDPASVTRSNDNESVRALAVDVRAQEKEIELLRRTADSYRDQTTLGLGLVGLLLGLVGLLLPFIAYMTSILPAQRVVAEAHRTLSSLDERFVELSAKERHREIQRAIERLASPDHSLRSSAASHLAVNAHFAFDDNQIRDICQIAENADFSLKLQLFTIISGRDSPVVTRILESVLRQGAIAISFMPYVLKQMTVPSGRQLRAALKSWISAPETRAYAATVLHQAAAVSGGVLQELLNDAEFWKGLGVYDRAAALIGNRAAKAVSVNQGTETNSAEAGNRADLQEWSRAA
jgi:hypothetical protein